MTCRGLTLALLPHVTPHHRVCLEQNTLHGAIIKSYLFIDHSLRVCPLMWNGATPSREMQFEAGVNPITHGTSLISRI